MPHIFCNCRHMKKAILLTVICWLMTVSCSRIVEPEFRQLENFRVRSLGLDQVTIGLGMTFYNPNSFTVTVKETGAKVYLDKVFLGDFIQDSAVAVGDKTDFTIPLSGTIPLTTFLKMNLTDIHKRQVLIQADGSTKVGKAGIFISKTIRYAGRHRLGQVKL
jgi:LEA14-like dessication related protein